MTGNELTIGLLLDEPAMERWAVETVEEAIRTADASVEHVILSADANGDTSRRWTEYVDSATEYGSWSPVVAWHRLVNTPDYLEKVPLSELEWGADATVIRARPEPADGIGQRLPASTVERIRDAEIDLLFRRGFGILQGDILTTPTYGVLSFHHGNVREYRGRPTAVWEFANDESTAGITLQRLTPTLDGGEIVVEKTVDIGDCRTWQGVKQRLFDRSTDMLATACRRLEDPAFETKSVDELGSLYSDPGLVDTVRIELKNSRGKIANIVADG